MSTQQKGKHKSKRRGNSDPRTSNEDVEERLAQRRQINADAAADRISWQERVRQHEQLVPGIGPLDGTPCHHDHRNGRHK